MAAVHLKGYLTALGEGAGFPALGGGVEIEGELVPLDGIAEVDRKDKKSLRVLAGDPHSVALVQDRPQLGNTGQLPIGSAHGSDLQFQQDGAVVAALDLA